MTWLWVVFFGGWIAIVTAYHLVAQRRRKRKFERTMRERFKRR